MAEFLTTPTGFLMMFILIFTALGGGVWAYFTSGDPERSASDRLRDMSAGPGEDTGPRRNEAVDKITARLSALASPDDAEEQGKLRLKMVQAGYTNKNALEVMNATRVIMALGLPIVLVPTVWSAAFGSTFVRLAAGVIVLGAIGYIIPSVIVDGRVSGRQKKLMNSFPDALDLLVSSVEAGLGLDAAFRRIAEEIETAAPELAHEFQVVNHEISAGLTRLDALHHLADRTGLEEVQALVNMLTQAERFGTSIARSLRVHSSIVRQKRMARAEEEAAKVSPKLTVVMILFLMPCLMIVLLGPAAISIKHNLIDKK